MRSALLTIAAIGLAVAAVAMLIYSLTERKHGDLGSALTWAYGAFSAMSFAAALIPKEADDAR